MYSRTYPEIPVGTARLAWLETNEQTYGEAYSMSVDEGKEDVSTYCRPTLHLETRRVRNNRCEGAAVSARVGGSCLYRPRIVNSNKGSQE